jgi:class 3 adenylate cyclase/tetratricopeptide (TPR) repeat protein
MDTQESFGSLVRRYRREAELSQEALAERAGLSIRAVRDIESGSKHRPRPDTVQLLVDALDLPADEQARFREAAAHLGTPSTEAGLNPEASESLTARVLSVLVADLRGYTAYTVEHGDEAAAGLARQFAASTGPVVEHHGGRLLELRGDEALCVFPSARQAIRAALALQEGYRPGEDGEGLPLGVGIGLDAGEVVPVHGGYRGRALNLAARLCALAKPGEVFASDGVLHLAGAMDGIGAVDRGSAAVKGLPEPVRVMQVTSAQEHPPDPPDPASDSTALIERQQLPRGGFAGSLPVGLMVGREAEAARLLRTAEAVAQGDGRLVLLAGEPGAGKTRLLQGITADVLGRGFLVAAGRCYEPEQSVPYYPFLDVLATLWKFAPAALRADAGERWPHLGVLLPEHLTAPAGEASRGQDDQQRVFRAVTGFLEAMAESAPIALLLDDLHWADGTSLKLLRHIATHTRAGRLLLLGAYRDVEVGRQHPLEAALLDLRREGLAETIPVRRLTAEGTAALVAATLHDASVPGAFTRKLHARTEGNPFFTRQVLDVLVQRDGSTPHEGRWDRRAIEEMEVPESIRAVVGRRLSQLASDTQAILFEAGVLGQRFRFDDLQQMAGRTAEEIEVALNEACEQRLLAEMGRDEYGFDHVLTQQVLDTELPARRKRRLHLAAGEMLERLPEDRRSERVTELAWHFQQADEPEKAMRYALAAGDQAAHVFAHDEAEQQYRLALGLARELGKREDEAEALERLGRVLQGAGQYDEALAVLEEVVAIQHQAGDLAREAKTIARMFLVHFFRGSPRDGMARIDAFLDALDGRDPPAGTARLYFYQSGWASLREPGSIGLAKAERVAALAQAEGDTATFILAETDRGWALRDLGRGEEAVRVLEAVASLAEEQEMTEESLYALLILAETYLKTGRLEQARTQFAHSLEHYRRRGTNDRVAYCTAHIGGTYFADGNWREARLWYERALQIEQAESRSWGVILPLAWFGELALREGKWAEAERLLDGALTLAGENQDGQWLYVVHDLLIERDLLRGQVEEAFARHQRLMADPDQAPKLTSRPSPALAMAHLAAGGVDTADELIENGIEFLGEDGADVYLWVWIALRARVLATRKRWAESEATFLDAIARVRRARNVFFEGEVLQWHGEVLAAQGEVDQARERLQEARVIYARVGAAPYLAQTDEALERLAG